MSDAFGLMSPEDTRMVLETVRQLRASGLLATLPSITTTLTPPTPYYVHNDSGETIPTYACMQVTGTEEIGEQNYLVVDKPADTNGDAGSFVFNGPHEIADNEEGIAQFGPVVRAFKNTGTVTGGEHWIPVSGQWYIAQDDAGQFVAAGADDVEDDVLRIFTNIGGGGSKFYVAKLTADFSTASTPGSATCTIYDPSDESTSVATGVTVYGNLDMFDDLVTDDYATCVKAQDNEYYMVNAPCGASGSATAELDGGTA